MIESGTKICKGKSMKLRNLNIIESLFFLLHKYVEGFLTPFFHIKLQGPITKENFSQAVRNIQREHPILQTVIHTSIFYNYFYRKENFAQIPIEFYDKEYESQWKDLFSSFSRHKFDTKKGPLLKIFCLLSTNTNKHDILIIAHHSIFDVTSCLYFIDKIITAINADTKKSHDIEPKTSIIEDKLLSNKLLQLNFNRIKIQLPNKNNFQSKYESNVLEENISIQKKKFRQQLKNSPLIYNLEFDTQQTKNILTFCKTNEVNFFGVLAAIYFRALSKSIFLYNRFKSLAPINLRDYYEPSISKNVIGCYVASLNNYFFTLKPDLNLVATAKYCDYQLRSKLKDELIKTFSKTSSNLVLIPFILFYKINKIVSNFFYPNTIGLSIINNGGKYENICKNNISLEEFHWAGNGGANHRKINFHISAITINGRLSVSFASDLLENFSENIFTELSKDFVILSQYNELKKE